MTPAELKKRCENYVPLEGFALYDPDYDEIVEAAKTTLGLSPEDFDALSWDVRRDALRARAQRKRKSVSGTHDPKRLLTDIRKRIVKSLGKMAADF